MQKPQQNICLTVDVEEYFHAANLKSECPIRSWNRLPSRIEESTENLLDIFDKSDAKGTFFILGYSAKTFPSLVKLIKSRGHEIASHGYAHKIAYHQNYKQFKRDVERSKKLLEDITGEEIFGYRAPNFSIVKSNLWAYDALIEAGYKYDSSLNPVHHHRYGNVERSRHPEWITGKNNKKLLVLPLNTFKLKGMPFPLPIAGGAYWRLLPFKIIDKAVRYNIKNGSDKYGSPICYVHPWEIDPQQPYFPKLSANNRIRHYVGIKNFAAKINRILENFHSTSINDAYLRNVNLTGTFPESNISSFSAAE